jgi:dUTP pyrophosphatase
MDILEQLLTAFDDLFEMEDSELETAMPVISQELTNTFMGPTVEAQVDEYFRQCDLMGYTLDQYSKDLEAGRAALYQVMTEIKEKYSDSQVKSELVDMVYSLIESFYAVIALRIASREKVTIGIELVHPNAKIPTYAHDGDQGADVYAVEDITIEPHTYGNMVPTGIKMMIPHGWAVAIRPRSGMSKNTPLRISNSPATIDQQYRGEVKILFDNFSNEAYSIKAGDRIAQFVLEKNYRGDYIQVDAVEPDTDRGEGGFGSSGN